MNDWNAAHEIITLWLALIGEFPQRKIYPIEISLHRWFRGRNPSHSQPQDDHFSPVALHLRSRHVLLHSTLVQWRALQLIPLLKASLVFTSNSQPLLPHGSFCLAWLFKSLFLHCLSWPFTFLSITFHILLSIVQFRRVMQLFVNLIHLCASINRTSRLCCRIARNEWSALMSLTHIHNFPVEIPSTKSIWAW
jgi:hypothetical protein